MKRSPLQRRTELKRTGLLNSTVPHDVEERPAKKQTLKRAPISPASPAQRMKVRDQHCVVCGRDRFEATIDPAHLASRAQGGGDDPLDVVALCRQDHTAFDQGRLDLLPYLEPRYRDELAQCVRHLGLLRALHRLTGERWTAEDAA